MPADRSTRPLRVGLTGTVAAGKSVVGRLFEAWGAPRIDADELAREAVRPGSEALERIREAWGEEMLCPDGSLDREALRRRVFEDPGARARLERYTHGAIRALRDRQLARAAETGARIVVEEIPLLFEKELDGDYDAIVVVDAPPEVRRERARASRGWTSQEFDAIDRSQLPASEKRARADHVIQNAGDLGALESAARRVWAALLVTGSEEPPERVDDSRGRA